MFMYNDLWFHDFGCLGTFWSFGSRWCHIVAYLEAWAPASAYGVGHGRSIHFNIEQDFLLDYVQYLDVNV
jgi:hypothetical protein